LTLIAAVDDLFFATRIRETARQAEVPVEVVPAAQCESSVARRNANEAACVIVDLNSAGAVDLIRRLKARTDSRPFILGFVSHVASDQISAARQAGCDQVMARSAFTQQLPDLLRRLGTGR
jgi:DNA-binding NarL/FixJ family response regulator